MADSHSTLVELDIFWHHGGIAVLLKIANELEPHVEDSLYIQIKLFDVAASGTPARVSMITTFHPAWS